MAQEERKEVINEFEGEKIPAELVSSLLGESWIEEIDGFIICEGSLKEVQQKLEKLKGKRPITGTEDTRVKKKTKCRQDSEKDEEVKVSKQPASMNKGNIKEKIEEKHNASKVTSPEIPYYYMSQMDPYLYSPCYILPDSPMYPSFQPVCICVMTF